VLAGEALSMLGDTSYEVAFAWLVLTVSRSPATLGVVLLAGAVPRGLLLLVGGAVTDRLSARTVMLTAHVGRAAVVGALTALVASGTVRTWHFVVAGIAFGVADAFFWPASGAIVPSLVPPAGLTRANSLLVAAEQVSRLAGPLLGGALMVRPGPAGALAFNGATFAVAAATVLRAPRVPATRGEPVPAEIRNGLSYARRSADLRIVLLLVSAATLAYSGLFAVGLPALSRRYPHGSVVLGVLLSANGLGQLAGTVAAGVAGLPRRWGLFAIGMAVAEGTSFALLALAPRYLVAAVLLGLLGIAGGYSDVALPTFVQSTTPADRLGRVTSLVNLPRVVLAPVSLALAGLLAAADVRWPFAAAAAPLLLVGVCLAGSATARGLSLPR